MATSAFSIIEVGSRRYRVRTELSEGVNTCIGTNSKRTVDKTGDRNEKLSRQSVRIPRQLHKYIVGTRGSTLERLRSQSHAKITVPAERSKSDLIEIEGSVDEKAKAEELIAQVVEKNLRNVPYTHFISLPLTDLDIQRKIEEFQNDAKQRFLRVVDSAGFVQPGSLHITLGMLRLLTPDKVTEAVELLRSLSSEIHELLGSRPLVVKVGQLAAMEPDVTRARIIYANVEEFAGPDGDRLQKLCAFVRDAFDSKGFIDEDRPLKIHVTVIRARAAQSGDPDDVNGAAASAATAEQTEGADQKKGKARGGFSVNAGPLLRELGGLSFGVCRIGQIQIARRFRHAANGAYENDGSVALP
ncbi:activating signal cointegrator 1 complex subunit [Coemansia guatemalensis]|uniref:Activating signal cointegrator 1 complex subunit n=1 Tax=Coemansia guatemalensis TaxID=2761395 RepID=A0A9W8HR39_9FUNG|nr:activating signal cointegrator 1 complex subunit [Coemansia guatemalensis]